MFILNVHMRLYVQNSIAFFYLNGRRVGFFKIRLRLCPHFVSFDAPSHIIAWYV